MAMVAAKCTMCGSSIKVDDSQEKGVCEHCGTEFITEKVINVTNITNVDKSTNIYYGETTDAKIKKDLEKAYKTLETAGCDLANLTLSDGELNEELCTNAYTLAKGVTKKDPTNYSAWKCIILAGYISYFAGECAWLVDLEKCETADDIMQKIFKDIATAKKVAPNDEERKLMDILRDNVKINYYQNKLREASTGSNIAKRVSYLEKPEKKEKWHKALVWIGGYIVAMGLLLLINNVAKLNLSFIPKDMTGSNGTITIIMLIVTGLILIGVYIARIYYTKHNDKNITKVEEENRRRFNEKAKEIDDEIASAKTLKDYETLAAKYNIDKI